MSRTLTIRLSSLGDVAILIPVLYSVAKEYPHDEFFVITKNQFSNLFEIRPENVKVVPVYTKGEHRGLRGLGKLIREINSIQIDQIADLHNVLRSKLIDSYFKAKGKKIARIDKGRGGKKALTRRYNKKLHQLPTSIERYQRVFEWLGYNASLSFTTIFDITKRSFSLIEPFTGAKAGNWIGIAPFAKHQGKIYPLEKMEEVISILSLKPDTRIFLFGGGKEEKEQLESWSSQYENVVSVAGKFSLMHELLLMSYLDVMLSMDSGNMHLASLVNTPVVSVWGATHPYAGFYGYRQNLNNIVQIDLECRPCSVFGDKPCFRKDYACMNWITPQMVVDKIDENLK